MIGAPKFCNGSHDLLEGTTGGTDQDVEARLGKARVAFRAMDKLWTSQVFGRATKVNSNVKAVLLYASESWTVT